MERFYIITNLMKDPDYGITKEIQKYIELQLRSRMEEILQQKRHQFALYVEKMKGLSPLEKLNQGYAYVEDKKGRPVRQIADVKEGDAIRIYVSDGMIEAQVKGMTEEIQYHA